MALLAINKDATALYAGVELTGANDLFIRSGVQYTFYTDAVHEAEIDTDASYDPLQRAIFGEAAGHIYIDGSVVSETGALYVTAADPTDAYIYLGGQSLIAAFDADESAIVLDGGGWVSEFNGKIYSDGDGVTWSNAETACQIDNAGQIVAAGIGIDLGAQDPTNSAFTLDNSGLIKGSTALAFNQAGSVNIENSGQLLGTVGDISKATGSVITLENTGLIDGSVYLGSQNDTYDGRLGTLDGTLAAGGGNDILKGGADVDRFQGDAGRDRFTGGLGADVFIYADAGDSLLAKTGRDLIANFSHKQQDLLDFSALDLEFVGKSAFSGSNEIRYQSSGTSTFVYVNLDSDQAPEMAIELTGRIKLVASDFLL